MKLLRIREKESREERIREILRKVRTLDITTRKMVQEIFSGEYHSVFRGRGMEFSEVREYLPGDDVRTIDWNVTARMDRAYVKVFEEERELTVLICADMSRSSAFGTRNELKRDIAVEISALLAFSAIENSDLVGLLMFTDQVEKFIPPKKGKTHTLRIIRELLAFQPTHNLTDIANALEYINRLLKRSAIIFIISDFLDVNIKKPLALLAKKHDVIPIVISDPAEIEFAQSGVIVLEDAETGQIVPVDTSDRNIAESFRQETEKELQFQKKIFASVGVDAIHINTDEDYIKTLDKYFRMRAGKVR
ncbi:DUF58 domain-containing protein [bacterium]|nr:MAG: DUF58 domain-containing protein [bacterium]